MRIKETRVVTLFKESEVARHLLIITVIYALAHWLLLFLSGYWWDDSILMIYTKEERDLLYSMNGGVFGSLFTDSVIWMPHFAYRICVFFEFLLGVWLLYLILKRMELFSNIDCLWISLIFSVAPVNDARTMLICYGYSATWFLYFLGFYLATKWKDMNSGYKRWIVRALSLIALFISYASQSLLVMTGLIILYLYYLDYKNQFAKIKDIKTFLRPLPKNILQNIDYILIPILYWIIQTVFFQPWGLYEGKNPVTLSTLITAIKKLPLSTIKTYKSVIINLKTIIEDNRVIFLIVVCFIIYFAAIIIRNKFVRTEKVLAWNDIVGFIIGMVSFVAGLFPYSVVRNGDAIQTAGFVGRDSLCIGLGFAISMYFASKLILRDYLTNYLVAVVIFLGVTHFNTWYIQYQTEWYQELEFMNEVANNQEILDNNTFWVIHNYSTPCGTYAFYNLNVNSYMVTGEKTRFFSYHLQQFNEWTDALGYGIDNYDYSDMSIDGCLIFDNAPIGKKKVLKLKWDELFHKDKFDREIASYDRFEYIPLTQAQSELLMEAFNNGITSDSELLGLIQ